MVFADFCRSQFVQKYGTIDGLFTVFAQLEGKTANLIKCFVPGQYDTFFGATTCDPSSCLVYWGSSIFSGGLFGSSSPS